MSSYRTDPPEPQQPSVNQATGATGATGAEDPAGSEPALVELLRELSQSEGKRGAARRLGVDRRTVSKGISTGELTPRLTDALKSEHLAAERARAEQADARAEQAEQRAAAAEQRAAGLARAVQEQGGELERLRAQLAAMREPPASAAAGLESVPTADSDGDGDGPAPGYLPRRLHPELVTLEPAPGDEQVYRQAWPTVREWRRQRTRFKTLRGQIEGHEAECRMLELELRLVEQHQLTMPPDQLPWDRFARDEALRRLGERLEQAQTELRRARRRRWLRRLITLGLWGR